MKQASKKKQEPKAEAAEVKNVEPVEPKADKEKDQEPEKNNHDKK